MLDIMQALIKNAKSDFGVEERRRAEICVKCPEMKDGFYSDFFNSVIIEVKGKVCNQCSCPISSKVFAKDKENICKKWIR